MLKEEFLNRVKAIFDHGDLENLADEKITDLFAVSQYAADLLLNEAEKRGMLGEVRGGVLIPCGIPKDVEHIETILTRPPA